MSADIEGIMSGLLTYIRGKVPSFVTVDRRVKHWTQVAEQPALFLRRIGMHDTYNGSMPIVTIEAEIWIYCNAGTSPDVAPDEALTNLEREVRDAMAPDDPQQMRFTIGGLVHWCRIVGKSDISPGDQGPQAIARIPVHITIP